MSVSQPSVTILSTTSLRATWTSSQPGDSAVECDGGSSTAEFQDEYVTDHSVKLTGLIPGATCTLYVYSQNADGQLGGSDGLSITMPTVNTQISGLTVARSSRSVTISWITNVSASTVVNYGVTTAYGQTMAGPNGTTHSVTIQNLQPNTAYHYQIVSNGTTLAQTTDATFTTQAETVVESIGLNPLPTLKKPIVR